MNKRKQLRIENNKKIQLRIEFRNKFKYIVKKFISKNIFKEIGKYEELKQFGIIITTLGKDSVYCDAKNILFVTEFQIIVFIKVEDNFYKFYLDKSFNICRNELTSQYQYLYHDCHLNKHSDKVVKYIEEQYEKIKSHEEIEKELNKVELKTTQRKRVKI